MESKELQTLGGSAEKEKYQKPTIKTYTEEDVLKEYQACGITF